MKKLLIFLLVLSAGSAIAQNFEGTLKWVIKMELTDPKQKAQMEQAQKQMGDPATQAQMKELAAKMNDPQFKAMVENNPQMKAQIELALNAAASGDLSSLFPTGLLIHMRGGDVISKFEGGAVKTETLYIKSKDQSYTLDRANKTYSVLSHADKKETAPTVDVKVTKTSETAKILNYTCAKYLVEIQDRGKTITQNVWATTEIKEFDLKALSRQRFGGGKQMFYDQIDGVALKIEMKMQGMNIQMEMTEIKKGPQNEADFVIPAGFKEVAPMFKN